MDTKLTSLAGLFFNETEVSALHAGNRGVPVRISESYVPTILEIFASYSSVEEAYGVYRSVREARVSGKRRVLDALRGLIRIRPYPSTMLLYKSEVFVCTPEIAPQSNEVMKHSLYEAYLKASTGALPLAPPGTPGRYGLVNMTALSRETPLIASTLQTHLTPAEISFPDLSREDFAREVQRLYVEGFLTTLAERLDFGSFKRYGPLCPNYGYSRGTPIDRYYLEKFIAEIRDQVAGDTLEVGGRRENQKLYGFNNPHSYTTMDVEPHPDVAVVADVHHADAFKADSFDTVVILNVLEHCENPSLAVANVHRWLRNGGRVFCMVPNAQRVHGAPHDFWRPLPAAIKLLFSAFSRRQLFVYGNTLSTIASLMGVAAEELSPTDLDWHDRDYPVATCIIAEK
jgi:SAM-dependent methyltransferase